MLFMHMIFEKNENYMRTKPQMLKWAAIVYMIYIYIYQDKI
jgi:hypothetical protein